MRGTDRDKAAEAWRDRKVEQTRSIAGMVDSYLTLAGVIPAISTIDALRPANRDRRCTTDNLRADGGFATEGNGGRDGQLYFMKSRGARHSNPFREFMRRGERFFLPEVYIECERVQTGSARVATRACMLTGGDERILQSLARTGFDGKATNMKKKAGDSSGYNLCLYIAGQTPKSVSAICNLRRLCEKYLAGRYSLDVVDLMVDPNLAQRDEIIAVPTLVRHLPAPIKRIIGDLSNSERVLMRLGIDVGSEMPQS